MQELKIDGERLWQTLMETAAIGGTADGGIRRLTLTQDDRRIRDWFCEKCRELGCTVTVDEVGNIFAVRPGGEQDHLPIAVGSHLDTQPTGGKFDGILGVLAGIEILQVLHDAKVTTKRPIMVVNWTNEEGARFAPAMLGSGVHAGVFDRSFADTRLSSDGVTFGDALEAIGYRGPAAAGSTKFACMLELHIEQGPILEKEQKDIGIVLGVQGARWFDCVISGRSAHAGSTPMAMRQDALLVAASIALSLKEIASRHGGLATVGEFEVENPSRNVVPGKVRMSVDLRHHEDREMDAMEAAFRDSVTSQAASVDLNIEEVWNSRPTTFDQGCIDAITKAVSHEGLSSREMVSGAGHDSVYVSKIAPTAMIFIPCRDGLSHNPAEYSDPLQCAKGAQVLLASLVALAGIT